jgi:antibiotic biosynthesis monooxygenase (ABM) superfamily enzyme
MLASFIARQKGNTTMYGTVARMRLKPGMEGQVTQLMKDFEAQHVPGFVATYIYRMDADANDYYIAVVFTDKEKYWANAQSAEQDARYRQLRALLESDPEWHDGEIVSVSKGAAVGSA